MMLLLLLYVGGEWIIENEDVDSRNSVDFLEEKEVRGERYYSDAVITPIGLYALVTVWFQLTLIRWKPGGWRVTS